MPATLLTDDEAHLWLVRYHEIASPALREAWRSLLSPDECQRCDRYLFEPGRLQFLAARALVRTTLSRYADVPPRLWRFQTNPWGRPEISAPIRVPPLCFNLSHCEGMVACLVALDREVGVDVEDLERRGPSFDVANRYFSPFEVATLRALPESEQRRRFFDYWTLKEAYIKARGMGLAIPLHHFWFTLAAPGPPRIAFDERLRDDPASWQFNQLQPTARHPLATAIRLRPSDGKAPLETIRLIVRETVPLGEL